MLPSLALLLTYPTVQRASLEITPAEPLPLGGYTARGAKVLAPGGEPLYARATIVSPMTSVIVVTLDMLTIPEGLYDEVRQRLRGLDGVPGALFLIATHTHCAPDSQMLNERSILSIPGIANYKSRWKEWYAERIVACIKLAHRAPKQAVASWDVTTTHADLNRGRRIGALPDTTATLIGYRSLDGKAHNLWFHYAAHAVFWGPERMQTSGDWPAEIQRRTGADVLVGAIGDVSPAAEGATPADRIANFGSAMAVRLTKGATYSEEADQSLASEPSHRRRTAVADVQRVAPVPHPQFAKLNRIPEVLAQSMVDKFASPNAPTIQAFRFGKVAIVGIPGEPTSHLGREIRDYGKNLGFRHVLVCSHVNGWIGYILDANDYARGGYEATLAMHGPGQGERVVKAAKEALRKLIRD